MPGRAWGWLIRAAKVRGRFQAPTQNHLWWYCTPRHSPGHWKDLLIRVDWLTPAMRARLILALKDSSGTQISLRNPSRKKHITVPLSKWRWGVLEIKQGVIATLCLGGLYHMMASSRSRKSEQHQLYYVLSLWGGDAQRYFILVLYFTGNNLLSSVWGWETYHGVKVKSSWLTDTPTSCLFKKASTVFQRNVAFSPVSFI